MELTAERSLEIITEQLEKSRRAVSKDTGQWLFVTGLIAMIMSVIVASANLLSWTPLFHLLWFALPVVIWLVMKYVNRNRVPVPESLVGTLVRKTWYTILAFALVYSVYENFLKFIFTGTISHMANQLDKIVVSKKTWLDFTVRCDP